MKVLVTGGSGLVGSHLLPGLRRAGHEPGLLVRHPPSDSMPEPSFAWNPAEGELDHAALDEWGPDAVVHLAGKNIGAERWNERVKRELYDSRVPVTEKLSRSLIALKHRPRVFISASAIGYYGSRGEEPLIEKSPPGTGFFSRLVTDWEQASAGLAAGGIRRVCLRFGAILSQDGGALARMLPPFKLGFGGRFGSGDQWMSWISIRDAVRTILFALRENLSGPYNAASPEPVRNEEFAAALGRALHRPALVPAPAFVLRLLLGRDMADCLLLSSQRVLPLRLQEARFRFHHSGIEECLAWLLSRPVRKPA